MIVPTGWSATDVLAASDAAPLGPLSSAVLNDLDDLTDRLMNEILKREPSYATLPAAARDNMYITLKHSVELGVRSLTGTIPLATDPAAISRETGRLRALQGIPLEAVLRAYQLGGRIIWDALLAASREHFSGAYDYMLLDAASDWWRSIDNGSSELIDAYRLEEAKHASHRKSRETAYLNAVLDVDSKNPALFREAAEVLGLPENGPLLCVVAPVSTPRQEPLHSPQGVLAAHGIVSSWHFQPTEVIGVVALENRIPGNVREILEPAVAGPVGASPAVDGIAHLRRAYRMARTAARTLTEAKLATLDDRLPEALVVNSPFLAGRLPQAALGDLLTLPEHDRKTLLDTLEALLACHGSATHAARRLYCHRNTVLYRIQRIETVTGRKVTNPRDHLLLTLGIVAMRTRESFHDSRDMGDS